jgi:1,4-alpha-glucan branching enzyme
MDNKLFITDYDAYLFGQGTHYEIYNKMGAHPTVKDGEKGVYFAVWAPKAREVYVIGDFNDWNEYQYRLTKVSEGGIWDAFVPGVKEGALYKYLIISQSGEKLYKADPYANASELRPGNASRVVDISGYKWGDGKWIEKESSIDHLKEQMCIYECHLGSWKKLNDGTEDGFYNYRSMAEELCKYVTDMGYSHIELMGISEYPFDASWGYQVTGYYAPTSRYGSPKDFMYFVDYMHKHGIGVILDWVPAHFPKDAHGLANFDGSAVYEYADPRKGEHPDWGTKVFDYGKTEVKNFLIANAMFWIDKYHIDGLRVDAVASMLYLDYGRQGGQWVPNKYGGNGNLEAMDFLRHLNKMLNERYPRAVTIAEESTAWPAVSGVVGENDSLGFTFKWNMGWMHDFLEYMKCDPLFRKGNHNKMTFSLMYAYSERFILVLSHDEVVHLKCSMLNKMPGVYEDKFKNLKLAYAYMIGHPGKKLLFMGQEFGQPTEWSEARALDWHVAAEPLHADLSSFVKKLFNIYRKYPALYTMDYNPDGFKWSNANDSENSVFSFMRFSEDGKKSLLFVLNFTPIVRNTYKVGVPCSTKYKLILDEKGNAGEVLTSAKADCSGFEDSVLVDLDSYGIKIYEFTYKPNKSK